MWSFLPDTVALFLAFCYGLLQLRALDLWGQVKALTPNALDDLLATRVLSRQQQFSIVIAARNEAPYIGAAIAAVQTSAPACEVLVVDDHSDDHTNEYASEAGAKVVVLSKGQNGKKAALSYGISQATAPWVATLDADTVVAPGWFAAMNAYTYPERIAVVGPVMLSHDGSWWQRWQSLDFCGMMAITAASLEQGHFAMGNGANLAFAKTAFDQVDGYAPPPGKAPAASGDDMVLLTKLLGAFPEKVVFAKSRDAVVLTPAQADLPSFIQQRLRWAAKTGLNHQPILTVTLGLVWSFHVIILCGVMLALVDLLSWVSLGISWAIKLIVDYLLLRSATKFFGLRELLDPSYVLGSIVHALYVAGIGTLALLPIQFRWKGRNHRV